VDTTRARGAAARVALARAAPEGLKKTARLEPAEDEESAKSRHALFSYWVMRAVVLTEAFGEARPLPFMQQIV